MKHQKAQTILYVEDEQSIQAEMIEVLELFCENLVLANNGQQGLEFYQEHQPNIVVSDIRMPIMNGIDMVRHIKEINPQAKIIFTTAFSDADYIVEAINLQADGYILKPINLVQLETKIIDIIQQEKFLNKLKQQQKMEAVGQLAGGVAHDFNNLLTIIMGNLDLLKMQLVDSPAGLKRIYKIMSAAENAADLTQKMLAISRQKTMKFEEVDIASLLSESMGMLEHSIKGKVKIHSSFPSKLPTIIVDPNELTNALINLVVNAQDAIRGKGDIYIKAEIKQLNNEYIQSISEAIEPGEYLLIYVTDTGEGIPPEIIEKVFEPFFTTKEKGKGTGLGLSMIYGFIKQSRGHMRIYSEPGHGTEVHLYFPIKHSDISGFILPEDNLTGIDDRLSKGLSALIVDDEEDVAEIASFYLEQAGFKTSTLPSADKAIEELKNTAYDLVLTDVVMPGKYDGIDLSKYIKENLKNTVVVLSSGFSKEIIAKQHELTDELFLLKKPYSKTTFINTIAQAINAENNTD